MKEKRKSRMKDIYQTDGTAALCLDFLIDANEYLNFAINNGMLALSGIQEKMAMIKRQELLEKNPHEIWQGKNPTIKEVFEEWNDRQLNLKKFRMLPSPKQPDFELTAKAFSNLKTVTRGF